MRIKSVSGLALMSAFCSLALDRTIRVALTAFKLNHAGYAKAQPYVLVGATALMTAKCIDFIQRYYDDTSGYLLDHDSKKTQLLLNWTVAMIALSVVRKACEYYSKPWSPKVELALAAVAALTAVVVGIRTSVDSLDDD